MNGDKKRKYKNEEVIVDDKQLISYTSASTASGLWCV